MNRGTVAVEEVSRAIALNRRPALEWDGGGHDRCSLEARVMGATPFERTWLLMNGAVERADQASRMLEQGDSIGMDVALEKCRRIVITLRTTLNHRIGGDLSQTMGGLYRFVEKRLQQVQQERDMASLGMASLVLANIAALWRGWMEQWFAFYGQTSAPSGITIH